MTEEEDQEIVLKHAKREGIIDIHEHLSKVTETEEVSHILARLQLQRALKKHKFARMLALTDATKGQGKGGEGASGGGAGDGSGADGGAADTPGGAPVTTLADDVNEVGGGSEVGTGEGRTTGHEGEGRRTGLAAVSGADNAADGGGGGGGSGGGRGVDGGEGGDGGGGGSGGDGGGGGSCGRIELHHQSPAEPEPEPEPPV